VKRFTGVQKILLYKKNCVYYWELMKLAFNLPTITKNIRFQYEPMLKLLPKICFFFFLFFFVESKLAQLQESSEHKRLKTEDKTEEK